MQILALEKELKAIDARKHAEVLRQEAAAVWTLKKRSVIRDIWFTVRGRHAVVMLECDTEDEAVQHLNSLPLVREGFIAFEVSALRSYDGFDRLIAGEWAPT
ncbi:MAG: hypothetical protein KBC32_11360 [Candidatus Didemnitutus sp.]|nr:hypothetical protein [Candidatus Didemnitutus sp.]